MPLQLKAWLASHDSWSPATKHYARRAIRHTTARESVGDAMRFTDLFIRRPVIAIVVNVVIIIAGLQAISSLTVRQYPKNENATVSRGDSE